MKRGKAKAADSGPKPAVPPLWPALRAAAGLRAAPWSDSLTSASVTGQRLPGHPVGRGPRRPSCPHPNPTRGVQQGYPTRPQHPAPPPPKKSSPPGQAAPHLATASPAAWPCHGSRAHPRHWLPDGRCPLPSAPGQSQARQGWTWPCTPALRSLPSPRGQRGPPGPGVPIAVESRLLAPSPGRPLAVLGPTYVF